MVQKLKSAPPPKRLFLTLIRHGQTEENANSIIQGQMNTKLNKVGLMQAQALATHFHIEDFDVVYSSDLARAYETCLQLVGPSPVSSSIRTDRRLRARNFGALEGKPVDRLLFEALGSGAGKTVTDFTPAGAESAIQVQERVIEFLERRLMPKVAAEANRSGASSINVLIVTHSVVIAEMLAYLESFASAERVPFHQKRTDQTMRTPNTSVTHFRVQWEPAAVSGSKAPTILSAECYQSHSTAHLA